RVVGRLGRGVRPGDGSLHPDGRDGDRARGTRRHAPRRRPRARRGGFDGTVRALASAELYDPAVGGFTPTASMFVPRGNQTATLLASGRVLVAGGYVGYPAPATSEAELYDPATQEFAFAGSMASPRGDHTATSLADGRVLVAGGYTWFPFGGSVLSSAEI